MPEWVTCTITSAQVNTYELNSPIMMVALADIAGSFGPTYFRVPDIAKREMLAVALAAITSQSEVEAFVDDPSQPQAEWCYTLEILSSSDTAAARQFAASQHSLPTA